MVCETTFSSFFFFVGSKFSELGSKISSHRKQKKNIGTQGVKELFFCDLKAPGGCSTRWTGLLTDIIRVTHSCILVPDSSQCHCRVKYSCTNFDDCCP